jgi:hypothetical protein
LPDPALIAQGLGLILKHFSKSLVELVRSLPPILLSNRLHRPWKPAYC